MYTKNVQGARVSTLVLWDGGSIHALLDHSKFRNFIWLQGIACHCEGHLLQSQQQKSDLP